MIDIHAIKSEVIENLRKHEEKALQEKNANSLLSALSYVADFMQLKKAYSLFDEEKLQSCVLDGQTFRSKDEIDERIQEIPLDISVRSDWHSLSDFRRDEKVRPGEYKILLGTGGPAVQIVGDLNEYGSPVNATLQHQDWFTPWIDVHLTDEQQEALDWFVEHFYFETF